MPDAQIEFEAPLKLDNSRCPAVAPSQRGHYGPERCGGCGPHAALQAHHLQHGGSLGVETNVIPLPFVDTSSVASALSTKKHEIFNTNTKKLGPPVKACDI